MSTKKCRSVQRLQKSFRIIQHSSETPGLGEGANLSCPSSPLVKKAFRLIVAGAANTGKTAIVGRFLDDGFRDSYMPTIENFHRKMYKIRGELFQLDILDTSGNDPFPAARRISLLTGDIFLIVCSVDNAETFEEAFRIREQILDCKQEKSGCVWVPTVIAANKCDLPANRVEVDSEEGRSRVADMTDCKFLTCSAKTRENIDEIFAELFHLAKFPKQMSPKAHRRLTAEKSADIELTEEKVEGTTPDGSPRKSWKTSSFGGLKGNKDKPISYQDVRARRPSLRSDLLVVKAKTSYARSNCQIPNNNHHKCSIQ